MGLFNLGRLLDTLKHDLGKPLTLMPDHTTEDTRCAVCAGPLHLFHQIDGHSYHECKSCGTIQIDRAVLDAMDQGQSPVKYKEEYWVTEFDDARNRAWESSLARVAELFRYARIPLKNFVDVGTGPGYLLDALQAYLPNCATQFYGYEAFPPPAQYQTKHPHYIHGFVGEAQQKFDGGTCIEVIEHLTPSMAKQLAQQLAKVSNEHAVYMFNTGMPEYVKKEDIIYLDPTRRGHVVSYSLLAIRFIFEPHGFAVHPLKGKTWAFVLEYDPHYKIDRTAPIDGRIWSPLDYNMQMLHNPQMGGVMAVLGLESARAYWNA